MATTLFINSAFDTKPSIRPWLKPALFSALQFILVAAFAVGWDGGDTWRAYWETASQNPQASHFAVLLVGVVVGTLINRYLGSVEGLPFVCTSLGVVGLMIGTHQLFTYGIFWSLVQTLMLLDQYRKRKALIDEVHGLRNTLAENRKLLDENQEWLERNSKDISEVGATLEEAKASFDHIKANLMRIGEIVEGIDDPHGLHSAEAAELDRLIDETVGLISSDIDLSGMEEVLLRMQAKLLPPPSVLH